MKNYNKTITFIFTVIFITVFSYFNFSEYKNFHLEKKGVLENKLNISNKLQNFDLEKIKNFNDIQLYYTPNKKLLEEIVSKIQNAKKEIFLETYLLTEKRTQNVLINAFKKGIKVQVILEKSPYKAYNINNKSYNKLKKAGIDVVWSNKKNYTLNHSKVLLIDGLSIISTGNYSYSTFTKNRDFFIFLNDKEIYKKLKENFNNDFIGNKINIYDENLIFSPKTSRIKFEKILKYSKKNIKMYFQYLKDDELVNLLIKLKKEKNIDIEIILPKTASTDKNTIKLKKEGIQIHIFKKYKIHAKAILVDKKYLFIGSINFSNYSIDKNREIGILSKNKNIIENFLDIYKQDIKNSY